MNRDEAIQKIISALGEKKSDFIRAVTNSIDSYISSRTVGFCLTFIEKRSHGDKRWAPEPTPSYVKCLYAFCRNNNLNGNKLDSSLSVPVVELVSKQYEIFYEKHSSEISQVLCEALLKDKVFVKSLIDHIFDISNKEIPSALKSKVVSAILSKIDSVLDLNISHVAGHAISIATTKAVGVAVSLPIAHSTVALIVKFLALHLKVIISKVLASSAIKTMIAAAAKKIVVAAVIAAFVKIIGLKLSISAGAAFAFVIVPLVIAFITYEAYTLPEKLGKKVSEKVGLELSGNFNEVNRNIISEVFKQVAGAGLSTLAAQIAVEPEIKEAIAAILQEGTAC